MKSSVLSVAVLGSFLVQVALANWFTDLFHSSKAQEAHARIHDENLQTGQHKASWTHEMIAAAAGFEAMKSWEKRHPDQQGQVHTSLVKEALAGIAAGIVDNLIETKGLDWIDRQRAVSDAAKTAHDVAKEKYGTSERRRRR